jgi:hypothetical protein
MIDYHKYQKLTEKMRRKNGVVDQDIMCCLTCDNAYWGYEGELDCRLIDKVSGIWSFSDVGYCQICKKYKNKELQEKHKNILTRICKVVYGDICEGCSLCEDRPIVKKVYNIIESEVE